MTYWLQKLFLALLLIIAIGILPLIPARHVLLPLWPQYVNEIVIADDELRSSQRRFVSAWSPGDNRDNNRNNNRNHHGAIVARDRPRSMVAIELRDSTTHFGYLVGVRAGPEAALEQNPQLLSAIWVEGEAMADQGLLVLLAADESLLEFPVYSVVRMFRPNQLRPVDRIQLVWKRVAERWLDRFEDGLFAV